MPDHVGVSLNLFPYNYVHQFHQKMIVIETDGQKLDRNADFGEIFS